MSKEDDDIPEDFFNDLADDSPVDTATNDNGNDSQDDEQMQRCLAEIDKLQRNIERRKQKIKYDEKDLSSGDRKTRRSRSRSRSRSRNDRGGRDRGRGHRNERKRSRSRSRHRQRSRRSKSGSPRAKRSMSTHKNLSFLEELAQTFAARGQEFPEKDLLMQQNAAGPSAPMQGMPPNPMHFAQAMVGANGGSFAQQAAGFGGPSGSYYGINPMHALSGGPPGLNQVSGRYFHQRNDNF